MLSYCMFKSAEREVLSKMHTTCKIKILLMCAVHGMPQQVSKRRSGQVVFEFVTIFKGWPLDCHLIKTGITPSSVTYIQ